MQFFALNESPKTSLKFYSFSNNASWFETNAKMSHKGFFEDDGGLANISTWHLANIRFEICYVLTYANFP